MQMTTCHWMYNTDRLQRVRAGMRKFLRVAEENKRDSFMYCPCAVCMNLKEFCSSRSIQFLMYSYSITHVVLCRLVHLLYYQLFFLVNIR